MYILSWCCTENIPRLIPRPWWKFWSRDKLILEQKEVRKAIGMSDKEGKAFADLWNKNPDILDTLGKIMGQNVKNVQLEIGNQATPYIPISFVSYVKEEF